MKKLIVLTALLFGILAFTGTTESQAALPGYGLQFKMSWQGSWFFCFFSGSSNCEIIIVIGANSGLTKEIAEPILGYSIPSNSTPVVIQSPNFSTTTADGFSGTITEHIYSPCDTSIIEGVLDTTIKFPAQTMVYSSQYGGFIGWYIIP